MKDENDKNPLYVGISFLAGAIIGVQFWRSLYKDRYDGLRSRYGKLVAFRNMATKWVALKEVKVSIAATLANRGIKSVAIYGMQTLGKYLECELCANNIKTCYAIDKKADSIYADIDIYKPSDNLPKVDAVIVTAIFAYDEIKSELSKKCDYEIISLEEVIDETYFHYFAR